MKTEQVLESILAKFDHDIGVKADDLRKLNKKVAEQRKIYEIWKKTVADQQKEM